MSTLPISKIDRDCFLTIFDIITQDLAKYRVSEGSRDRPIRTIRAASQVCQQWREVLIGSPWIWGRIVDLDHGPSFPAKRMEWMDLVVKRAGVSPLWITGKVSASVGNSGQFNSEDFFIRLMDSWERIEKLSVVILCARIPNEILTRFLSRAPILKLFNVSIPLLEQDYLDLDALDGGTSQGRLFSDYAPSLQAIDADRMVLRPHSPWLSHIREMTVSRFKIEDICALLQRTPALERIIFSGRFLQTPHPDGGLTVTPIPKANLPHLSSIVVRSIRLRVIARILDYFSTCRPSVFRIDLTNATTPLSDKDVILFKTYLPVYISHYFNSNSSTTSVKIMFALSPQRFYLADVTRYSDTRPTSTNFLINIQTTFGDKDQQCCFMNCLVESIYTVSTTQTPGSRKPIFKSINKIQVYLSDIPPTAYSSLFSMLVTFNDVESIEIDECSGNILWEITRYHQANANELAYKVLFPALRIVYLATCDLVLEEPRTGLTEFLKNRKAIGFPVAELDLTTCLRSYYANDLSALEEVGGLKVVWKRPLENGSGSWKNTELSSYICGSGDPEQLKGIVSTDWQNNVDEQ